MTTDSTTKQERARDDAIREALKASSEHFEIPIPLIMGRSRRYPVARARHVAIYVARELAGPSYPQLARAFNRGDHNTAMNSCDVVRERIADDEGFKADVDAVLAAARRAIPKSSSQ